MRCPCVQVIQAEVKNAKMDPKFNLQTDGLFFTDVTRVPDKMVQGLNSMIALGQASRETPALCTIVLYTALPQKTSLES